jgi:glycosidase
LDYLQELGVTAIYFNPLFESPSLHKYDATMFHHIDNNFGPDPEEDRIIWQQEDPADPSTWQWTTADLLFLKLVEECHQREIRVIIDGVFNHVGYTFWAFQDVMRNQKNSLYKDWFVIHRWDDPNTPESEFDYGGWYGIKDLPEILEDGHGLVRGPREHVRAVVERWMDPNGDGDPSDGIDGWRLDVAEMVNIEFWRDFRKWVKEINPEAYITGEIWWDDWQKNKMMNAKPWLRGDAFDAVMNYRVARAIKKFVIDEKEKISAQAFVDTLQSVYRDYSWDNVLVCQNLMDSHDVDRLGSQIVNRDRWYDHWAAPKDNPVYDVRKPNDGEMRKLRMIVGVQMTLPGAPMVYYGDEAGMWGGDDPDCRKPMVWPELNYESETSHPRGKDRPKDKVYFDRPLFDWYRKIITIRKGNPTLSLGRIDFFNIDNEMNVLGYKRSYQDQSLYIVLNNNNVSKVVRLEPEFASSEGAFIDLVTDDRITISDKRFQISLEPYQIVVLRSN